MDERAKGSGLSILKLRLRQENPTYLLSSSRELDEDAFVFGQRPDN